MGVVCSDLNSKICPGECINVKDDLENVEKESEKGKEENKYDDKEKKEIFKITMRNLQNSLGIISKSNKKNSVIVDNLCSTKANFLSKSNLNDIRKTKTKSYAFTNFMKDNTDLLINEGLENIKVFDTNYISMKDDYNEEMINYLNKIRNEPKSIIEDIDLYFKEENTNNQEQKDKFGIENSQTHENIIFDDEGNALKQAKVFLVNVNAVKEKLILNEDLSIDTSDMEKNNESSLNKKITKILVDKRKRIINKYRNCQFFVNFIKDIKINLLYLLSEKEEKSNFRNILFNPEYKEFNVSWVNDKKNIFITFLCFA